MEWLSDLLSDVEWAKLVFDVVAGLAAALVTIATGIWAVLTWRSSREKDRQQRDDLNARQTQRRADREFRQRQRYSALYVLPFLEACDDLQSRIYNILDPEQDALPLLRDQYPDGTYAEETVHYIVRYFGWARSIRRYGPYTFDLVVIRLTNQIARDFATDGAEFPGTHFRFFRPQQRALGEFIMRRVRGEFGIEFETMSFYDFRKALGAWEGHRTGVGGNAGVMIPPLADVRSLVMALQALRDAPSGTTMHGRERLAAVHGHLLELLRHIEEDQKITIGGHPRKKLALTARGDSRSA